MGDFADPALYARGRLPAPAFAAASFLAFEERRLWPRHWVCIGAGRDIPSPGDLLPYTVGVHGVHVQRQPGGGVIGRYNKAHHGGCHLVPLQCRTGKKTRCGFSACGYSLDRRPILAAPDGTAVPDMHQYLGVRPETLVRCAVRETAGLLFVSLDAEADAAGLAAVASLPTHAWPTRWATVDTNWKLAAARLAAGVPVDLADCRWATTRLGAGGAMGIIDATWIFPNLILLRAPEEVCAVVLQPVAPLRTLCRATLFARDPGAGDRTDDWAAHIIRQATCPPAVHDGAEAFADHWHRWMIEQAMAASGPAETPALTSAHAVHARYNVVA